MNFIQYIDDTFSVKVKEVTYSDSGFLVSGIDTEFFILSLFLNNERCKNVDLVNVENLTCLSVMNDSTTIDLNVIQKNNFFTAYSEIYLRDNTNYSQLQVEVTNFNSDQKKDALLMYGVVRPLITIGNLDGIPLFDNNDIHSKVLEILSKSDGISSKVSYVRHGYVNKFQHPLASELFNIDDMYVLIDRTSILSRYFKIRLRLFPTSNIVFFDYSSDNINFVNNDIDVVSVVYNYNGGTSIKATFSCQGFGQKFNIDVYLDWKKIPVKS